VLHHSWVGIQFGKHGSIRGLPAPQQQSIGLQLSWQIHRTQRCLNRVRGKVATSS
jgi:hypothetical protein